ncbi:MAG: hypothetical protein JRJ66_10620 [Deltaproteobacteria bacterium]|nr:hypothetical protein [Deltaproteobacteria bacterium]MBW2045468.1 hypothetical protein [Deltaproteobacteria bacterium]
MILASVPDDYRNRWNEGILEVYEQAGTLWLWADPNLLGWRSQIRWLFSPVNTGAKRPGDVWGVDSDGNLLIVENKRARGGDPLQDFIAFVEDHGEPGTSAGDLLKEWEGLLAKERKSVLFWRRRPRGTFPGVLPYSRHRAELRRWPDITEKVEQSVLGKPYEQGVRRYLKKRERRGSPPPIYFGFYTWTLPKNVRPTPNTVKSLTRLVNGSNSRQVHLAAACAQRISKDKVQIMPRRIDWGGAR